MPYKLRLSPLATGSIWLIAMLAAECEAPALQASHGQPTAERKPNDHEIEQPHCPEHPA